MEDQKDTTGNREAHKRVEIAWELAGGWKTKGEYERAWGKKENIAN